MLLVRIAGDHSARGIAAKAAGMLQRRIESINFGYALRYLAKVLIDRAKIGQKRTLQRVIEMSGCKP